MHRHYEATFIIDAYLTNEQIEEKIQKYTKLIEESEGKIIRLERWGKRRLAYEIAKKQYGFYVYVRFEAPGTIVQTLERDFKLDDDILRYLTILLSPAALKEEARQADVSNESTDENAKKEEKTESDSKAVPTVDEKAAAESSEVKEEE